MSSRPSKYRRNSVKKRNSKDSWWDVIKLFLGSMLWYLMHIFLFVIVLFTCIVYFFGFQDTSEELRALGSIYQKGFVELASTEYVDSSLEGRVVFVQGKITTQDVLQDPYFNISVPALAFHVYVQFHQWDEHYYKNQRFYKLDWNSSPVSTHSFEKARNNTLIFPAKSLSVYSINNTLGAYTIAPSLLETLPLRHDFSLHVTQDLLQEVKEKILRYANTLGVKSESVQAYFSENKALEDAPLAAAWGENKLFLGLDINNPHAGDLLISYSYTPEQFVSFFATLKGNTLHLFVDEDNDASKYTVRAGKVSMEKVFSQTKEDNLIFFIFTLFAGTLVIFLVFFVEFQVILPFSEERHDYTKKKLLYNAKRAFKYTIYIITLLSFFAWFT